MAIPTTSGPAFIHSDPRISPDGGVMSIPLKFADRAKDDNDQWFDKRILWVYGKVFGEKVADYQARFPKGTEVYVTGRMHQSSYETRDGEKKQSLELLIDAMDVIIRPNRNRGGGSRQSTQQESTAASTTRSAGYQNSDEPPF